jgi:hypothetical protein
MRHRITSRRRLFFTDELILRGGNVGEQRGGNKITALGQSLAPQTAEEIQTRAERLYEAKNYAESANAYATLLTNFPNTGTTQTNLKRLIVFSNLRERRCAACF